MIITPFQALTVLARHYQNVNKQKYNNIVTLYLTGIRNEKDEKLYELLINDPFLKKFGSMKI